MKKMILLFAITVYFSLQSVVSFAQPGVAINFSGNTADSSAMLDVSSASKGLLIPRVALSSINDVTTIPKPATSLLVYNNGSGGLTPAGFYYWNGTQWVQSIGATGATGPVGCTSADYIMKSNGTAATCTQAPIFESSTAPYNVGIGKTNPQQALDILGTVRFNNPNYIDSRYVEIYSNMAEYMKPTNDFYIQPGGGLILQPMGAINNLQIKDASGGVYMTCVSVGSVDGVEIGNAYLSSTPPANGLIVSGSVGIGTSSPSDLFSVGSDSQFQVNSSGAIVAATGITSSGTITFSGLGSGIVQANSGVLSTGTVSVGSLSGILPSTNGGTGENNAGTITNANNTIITGGGTLGLGGYTLTVPATGTAALGTGTAGYYTKWSSANALTSSSFVYENSTGVGIGTTSPTTPLTVYSTTNGGAIYLMGAGYNGSNSPTISIGYWSGGNNTYTNIGCSAGAGAWVPNSVAGDFFIRNQNHAILFSTDNGNNTLLTLQASNGNVGIGVTNPSNLFSVGSGSTSGFQVNSSGQVVAGTWMGSVIGSGYGGAGTVSGILKANGSGTVSAATGGTDYIVPGGALGTPSSGNLANCTFPILNQNTLGSSASCTGNAATVTTNANLTGPIKSAGNTTSVTSQTGTGSTFVMNTSPTITGATLSGIAYCSGSVGIGTTAPANNLAVTGNMNASGNSFFGGTTTQEGNQDKVEVNGHFSLVNGTTPTLQLLQGANNCGIIFSAFYQGTTGWTSGYGSGNYRIYNIDGKLYFSYNASTAVGSTITGWGNETSQVAMTITNNGNIGINCLSPNYPLQVVGDIACSGTLRASTATVSTSMTACSDIRYKKNVLPMQNALSNVLKMQGVTFNWKTKEFPEKQFTEGNQIGFIAQELEKVYPEVVMTDDKGYKSVDYSRLTPVLVEAIKAQQKTIDSQQLTIDKQQAEIEKIKQRLDMEAKK